jgi:diaminopimelate decarboxylase
VFLGTQRVNSRGHLEIGGCDAVDLASEFGSPLYVMDEALIRRNMRDYRKAFETRYPKNEISYAGKAFLNTAMVKLVNQEGFGLDVASAGELYTAVSAGFPTEKILFHGNNKSRAELDLALDHKVGRIVVDNFLELATLIELAKSRSIKQAILIRVAPGVDPHTHKFIRTGQEDTKFGFNLKGGDALKAIKSALAAPDQIDLLGLHCHIGSQLLEASTHTQAVDIMVSFIADVAKETGWMAKDLDIGGGLGIRYLEEHHPPKHEQFADDIVSALTTALKKYDVPKVNLLQEPGRSIVGEAGTTLYTVGAIKSVPIPEEPGERVYLAVDGGLSDNPRPALYQSVYSVLVASKADKPADKAVTIAGKHCETDILQWNVKIADASPGDILAFQSTGAYNYSMASNYNRFRKPACVFVIDGKADLVSARETLEDLTRLDIVPERLAE